MPAVYQKMGDALLKTGRPIVYSLCQYGRPTFGSGAADVGGNLWRTTGDIRDAWESMTRIGFSSESISRRCASPGIGTIRTCSRSATARMTDTEYKTHMSLWAMLAAPLIAGNDLRNMTPSIHDILTNREVIAIDQDKAGHQGKRIWQSGQLEIWTRELAGGDTAVAVFNRAPANVTMKFRWAEAGVPKTPVMHSRFVAPYRTKGRWTRAHSRGSRSWCCAVACTLNSRRQRLPPTTDKRGAIGLSCLFRNC